MAASNTVVLSFSSVLLSLCGLWNSLWCCGIENPLPLCLPGLVHSQPSVTNSPRSQGPQAAHGVSLLGISPRCLSSKQWLISLIVLLDDSTTLEVLLFCFPRWVKEGTSGPRTSGENPSTLLLLSVLSHMTKNTAIEPGAHSCGYYYKK